VKLNISRIIEYLEEMAEKLEIRQKLEEVRIIFEKDFGIPPDEVFTEDQGFYATREFDWDEITAVKEELRELENHLLKENEEFTQIALESCIPAEKSEVGSLELLWNEAIYYVSKNSRIILRIRTWDDDC